MIKNSATTKEYQIPFILIIPFFLMTFVLAWGILGLYIFWHQPMEAIFGPITGQHPLFFLAVYAPAIAAFIIVLRRGGLKGFQQYFSRILLWRCSKAWYAFLFIGVPLVFYIGASIKGTLFSQPFPFTSLQALMLGLVSSAIKGPVEEFGWRGFALPLLQRKLAPVWAGLVLGIIWGVWHMPAFLLSGTQQSSWSFAPFFFGCIALSLIVTALFNASGGSILLSAIFHFMLMNPVFPDAQPYDTYIFLVVAVVVIWLNQKKMFSKEGSVIRIIPKVINEQKPA